MEPTPLSTALQDAKDTARDQLAAVWQLQVERIQEALNSGWKQQIEKVFEDRFAELGEQLDGEFRIVLDGQVEAGVATGRALARRELAEQLNQTVRRLRNAEEAEPYWQALADGCSGFAERVAVFSVRGQWARCEAARGFEDPQSLVGKEFAVAFAAAIDSAIATREMVIAVRAAGELSETLIKVLGESGPEKIYIFPVGNRHTVSGVLYVEQPTEISAIELFSNAAAPPAGAQSDAAKAMAAGLVAIAPASSVSAPPPAPEWSALSPADQEVHLRAQRFARVQVAEIRLYKAQAVKKGRAEKQLFEALHTEIDLAREAFRRQYMTATPTMVDYLHQELVRTLANDDQALLGPTYPGALG
ncbi:MAG: hypothetical protein NTY38_04270 [Acidobacteria bacterium]|nr:hypothetical protein [Acidobacteriota bacterium]